VTSAPSDADQDELTPIVTEAVDTGSSAFDAEALGSGAEPGGLPPPPSEPLPADAAEKSDTDMTRP